MVVVESIVRYASLGEPGFLPLDNSLADTRPVTDKAITANFLVLDSVWENWLGLAVEYLIELEISLHLVVVTFLDWVPIGTQLHWSLFPELEMPQVRSHPCVFC